jgi:hypothetical protein
MDEKSAVWIGGETQIVTSTLGIEIAVRAVITPTEESNAIRQAVDRFGGSSIFVRHTWTPFSHCLVRHRLGSSYQRHIGANGYVVATTTSWPCPAKCSAIPVVNGAIPVGSGA